MFTINGIGIKFLGYSKVDDDGTCMATKWITFLYFPILPLKKHHIKIGQYPNGKMNYTILGSQPLVLSEVISTYLWGWVWCVLLLAGPAVFTILAGEYEWVSKDSGLFTFIMFFGIAWFIFFLALLYNWDYDRGLPGRKSILGRFIN